MPRSKDLDTVAPDDAIETTPQSNPTESNPESQPSTEEDLVKNTYTILGHTKSSFSSTLVNPKQLDFSERNDQEKILIALRSHWFVNVSWILVTFLMLLVPLIFRFYNFLSFLPPAYQMISLLFWYLITFIFAFERFLDWYFDLYIITTERIVDISFNNLLNKKFAEAGIDMIQDSSSSVKGIAGTMFNYGTVLIQTASEVNQIIFKNVPHPEKVIKVLQEVKDLSVDPKKV